MRVSAANLRTDEPEAQAIATAIAQHLRDDITLECDGDTIATAAPPTTTRRESLNSQTDTTEREQRILAELEEILEGGPERGHKKLEKIGKYFVRDRISLIFDEVLYEDGTFAKFDADDRIPGDAIITGAGTIDGRKVYFVANDYTVKAGTIAEQSIEKWVRIQEEAIESKAPILYLIDSSGGRIDDQATYYADRYHGGKQFYNQCVMSGRVPQIAVLYGPDFAGTAYQPVFCDYLIMVEDISAMAIASPRIVEIVTGEDTTIDELGGTEVHAKHSGSADLVVADEEKAASTVKDLLGYLPDSYTEDPPTAKPRVPKAEPTKIDTIIPKKPNKPYDVHRLIDSIVDRESFLECKPEFAPEIVTGFGRIDGHPIGIIANQPTEKTGAIYPASSEKAAGFIWKCDAYNIPLLYLCDTPGFMVGKAVERDGILQRGRKFVYATSCATVPKISVIVRKAYGAGTYAMAGPSFDTDSVLGLPSSEIAVMGPKAAVNAVYRNKIEEIDDPEDRQEFIDQKRQEYREDIDIRKMASQMIVDELIPARDLRPELVNRFEVFRGKEKHQPDRKHGVMMF